MRREVCGCGRGLGVDGAGECMGVDACASDMRVTRTWLHHKHHCRLLRVSAQVERSMGGGSAAPCCVPLGGEWSCVRQTVKSWPTRQDCKSALREIGWYGWNEPWRGLMLLHASWNGCQKPCCNRFMTVLEGFQN